jgi:hypothetical protein
LGFNSEMVFRYYSFYYGLERNSIQFKNQTSKLVLTRQRRHGWAEHDSGGSGGFSSGDGDTAWPNCDGGGSGGFGLADGDGDGAAGTGFSMVADSRKMGFAMKGKALMLQKKDAKCRIYFNLATAISRRNTLAN